MKCLLVADLHYSLPQFDWVSRSAAAYDVVILAGDALDLGSDVDYRAQTIVVRKYLQRVAGVTRLIVCSGNHDLDSVGKAGEKVPRWIEDIRAFNVASDGDSIVVQDTLFTVCPWWDGPAVRARLAAQLESDSRRRGDLRWVWVHHAPPLNSPTSWSGSRSLGDADLAQWISDYGPDLIVAGHIHQSPFVNNGSWVDRVGTTWVFNMGHEFGALPSYVALDTTANEAVWISSMGMQIVRLNEPLRRPIPFTEVLPEWFRGARTETLQG